MDITTENFLELLPNISETIRECDFIAIDTELSGLLRERSWNRFDLPREKFATAVKQSRGYFIMQFGLSCFTRIDNLHYTNKTYNFYIFPQANTEHGDIDRTFSIQVHAIQFLSEHGFDFNKLFKHGLSYLTFEEKKNITSQLKLEMQARTSVQITDRGLPKFVPNTMIENCKAWLTKTKKFVGQRKNTIKTNEEETKKISSKFNYKDDDSEMTEIVDQDDNRLELRDCSTNHKRNIMRRVLECQPLFENIEVENACDQKKNETYLVIKYIDKEKKKEKEKNGMLLAKGFLEILELVIVSRKPLVGHNLALDLIQINNQFLSPLTDDYEAFKSVCKSFFPLIYDTKFIAHSILEPDTLTNNQSRLNDLYCHLRDRKNSTGLRVDNLDKVLDGNQLPHQAGYDAYMSGYCFIVLCESYILEKRKLKLKKEEPDSKPTCIASDNQIIHNFANKIHLSYSYDFKYYDLNGEEEEPDRRHVFYVEFPSTWTLEDLFQAFYHYGGVTVSRLSKTSALCALRDVKHIDSVINLAKKLKATSNTNHRIYTYDTYVENFKPKRKQENAGDIEDVEFLEAQ